MNDENAQSGAENGSVITELMKRQMAFADAAEDVIKSYRVYKPDTFLLHRLMNEPHDFGIHEVDGSNLLIDIADRFQAGITQRQRRNSVLFLSFIKMLFNMLPEYQKVLCSKRMTEEWQRMARLNNNHDYSPYFAEISTDFQELVDSAINTIYKADEPESKVDSVKDEIRWAMTISPPKVVKQLLYTCIHNPNTCTATLMLLRLVPSLFYDKDLILWHMENEININEPLLTVVLRRVIGDSRSYVEKAEIWDSIEFLAMSLIEKTPDEKAALMDQHSLLDLVLNELYSKNRAPMKSVETLTRIASRILSLDNPNELLYKYAGSLRDQPAKMLFLVPSVLNLILQYFVEYYGKSTKIIINLKSMLRSIGERMHNANVEFDAETRDFIFRTKIPWYIEFTVSRWFSLALGITTKRVPSAIFWGLSKDEISYQERKDTREYDNENIAVGFLRALVDLGMFDPEGALHVLDSKRVVDFSGVDILETLQAAVLEGYKKNPRPGVESWDLGALVHEVLLHISPELEFDVNSLADLIPHDSESSEILVVPFREQLKAETIPALRAPYKAPVVWPTDPYVPLSKKQIRQDNKDRIKREKELQRKVNERYKKLSDDLRQKWIAEGIIIPNQPLFWAERYKHDPRATPFNYRKVEKPKKLSWTPGTETIEEE